MIILNQVSKGVSKMGDAVKHRRKPVKNKPKKVVSISLSGNEGYKALESLDGTNHTLGKSGLVIDLIMIFKNQKELWAGKSDDEIIQGIKEELGLH